MPQVEVRKCIRKITFKLSETQIVETAIAASGTRIKIGQKESQLKVIKDGFKKELTELEAKLSEAFKIIASGEREEAVEVEDRLNYEDGVVQTWHDGQMLAERTMSNEERQLGMQFTRNPQQELPLEEGAPFNPPRIANSLDIKTVFLDDFDPELETQEVYVSGDDEHPTIVRHHVIQWQLEPGESCLFRRKTIDIHGTETFSWEKVGGSKLGAPAVELNGADSEAF